MRAASADSGDQALADRLSQMERRLRESEQAQQAVLEERDALRDPEPWTGYGDANAPDVVQRIRDGGVTEFGRAGLARIRDYEERHKDRVSVKDAVTEADAAARE
jgi:hypothetical protein